MRDDTAIVSMTSGFPQPPHGPGSKLPSHRQLGGPARLLHPAPRPNAHPTLLGRMGKWLTAHLVHRLLWVLVFSVSDMLICLFQTFPQGGACHSIQHHQQMEKEKAAAATSLPLCVRISNPFQCQRESGSIRALVIHLH